MIPGSLPRASTQTVCSPRSVAFSVPKCPPKVSNSMQFWWSLGWDANPGRLTGPCRTGCRQDQWRETQCPSPPNFSPGTRLWTHQTLTQSRTVEKEKGGADAACLTKTIRSVTNALKIRQSAPWVLALKFCSKLVSSRPRGGLKGPTRPLQKTHSVPARAGSGHALVENVVRA